MWKSSFAVFLRCAAVVTMLTAALSLTGDRLSPGIQTTSRCDEILVGLDDIQNEGREYEDVAGVLSAVPDLVMSDDRCQRFFGGESVVSDWAAALLRYRMVAVAKTTWVADPTRKIISAFTSICGTRIPPGYAAMVVATNGSFFDPKVDLGVLNGNRWQYYAGGSARARVVVLLHELAHLIGVRAFYQNDRGDPSMSAMNNGIVATECKKTIDAAVRMKKEAKRKASR